MMVDRLLPARNRNTKKGSVLISCPPFLEVFRTGACFELGTSGLVIREIKVPEHHNYMTAAFVVVWSPTGVHKYFAGVVVLPRV